MLTTNEGTKGLPVVQLGFIRISLNTFFILMGTSKIELLKKSVEATEICFCKKVCFRPFTKLLGSICTASILHIALLAIQVLLSVWLRFLLLTARQHYVTSHIWCIIACSARFSFSSTVIGFTFGFEAISPFLVV